MIVNVARISTSLGQNVNNSISEGLLHVSRDAQTKVHHNWVNKCQKASLLMLQNFVVLCQKVCQISALKKL